MNKLSDYTCKSIITDKTGVEGGYVNNPNDAGGETNFGITKKLADSYCSELNSKFGWDLSMINLTKDMAFYIYKKEFWDKMKGDDILAIHPLIADKLFDICINSGSRTGVKILQTILNLNNNRNKLYNDITADGVCGNATIKALSEYVRIRKSEGIERMLVMMLTMQGGIYTSITESRPMNEEFFYGWSGRIARDLKIYSKILWG